MKTILILIYIFIYSSIAPTTQAQDTFKSSTATFVNFNTGNDYKVNVDVTFKVKKRSVTMISDRTSIYRPTNNGSFDMGSITTATYNGKRYAIGLLDKYNISIDRGNGISIIYHGYYK